MAMFSRRERPPSDVLARLDPEERVVSWADTEDGGVVLVTPKGIWWPDGDGYRRIAWQHIDKAVWRDGVLSVIEADVVDDLLLVEREPVSATLTTPRDLPPTVRKRIDANVVRTQVLPVAGGAARFVARRIPGQDGVVWWARLEPGVRDDEAVRAAVLQQITELAATAGADARQAR